LSSLASELDPTEPAQYIRPMQPPEDPLCLVFEEVVRVPTKANTDSEGNANGIPGRRRTAIGA